MSSYRSIRCISRGRDASFVSLEFVDECLPDEVATLALARLGIVRQVKVQVTEHAINFEHQLHRVPNFTRPLMVPVPSVESLLQITVPRNPDTSGGAVGHTRRTARHSDSNYGVAAA